MQAPQALYDLYGIEPETQPIGAGAEATVYPLDDARVVCVYKYADRSLLADLDLMKDFYGSLDRSKVSFDVPEILSIDASHGLITSVDRRLHGRDLNSVYEALSDPERKKSLLGYIAAAQQIRNLRMPFPYFGEVLAGNPIREATWPAFLARKMQVALGQGQARFSSDLPEVDVVVNFMNNKLAIFDDVTEASLVHGDYFMPNVLVENGEVTAVLDFNNGLTVAGDFRMDLASAIIFLDYEAPGSRQADKELLMDTIISEHGEGIRNVIQFYELYYSLIFVAFAKNTGSINYRWAINTLRQNIEAHGVGSGR